MEELKETIAVVTEKEGAFQEMLKTLPEKALNLGCLLYTSPSPRDLSTSRMPSSA